MTNKILKVAFVAALSFMLTYLVYAQPTQGVVIVNPTNSITITGNDTVNVHAELVNIDPGDVDTIYWLATKEGVIKIIYQDTLETRITRDILDTVCDLRIVVKYENSSGVVVADSSFVHVQTSPTPFTEVYTDSVKWGASTIHLVFNGDKPHVSYTVYPLNTTNPSVSFRSLLGNVSAMNIASGIVELSALAPNTVDFIEMTANDSTLGVSRDTLAIIIDSTHVNLVDITLDPSYMRITMTDFLANAPVLSWRLNPENASDTEVNVTTRGDSLFKLIIDTANKTIKLTNPIEFKEKPYERQAFIDITHEKTGKFSSSLIVLEEDRWVEYNYDTLWVNVNEIFPSEQILKLGKKDLKVDFTYDHDKMSVDSNYNHHILDSGTFTCVASPMNGGISDSIVIVASVVMPESITVDPTYFVGNLIGDQNSIQLSLSATISKPNTTDKRVKWRFDADSGSKLEVTFSSTTELNTTALLTNAGGGVITVYSLVDSTVYFRIPVILNKPLQALVSDKNLTFDTINVIEGEPKFVVLAYPIPADANNVVYRWQTSDNGKLPLETIPNTPLMAYFNPLFKGKYLISCKDTISGISVFWVVNVIAPVGISERGVNLSHLYILNANIKNDDLLLDLVLPQDSDGLLTFTLYDILGLPIWTDTRQIQMTNQQTLKLYLNTHIQSGTYFIHIRNKNQTTKKAIIVTR